MTQVYSPCRESLPYRFNSRPGTLKAQGVTTLPEAEARHAVELFKDYGVLLYNKKADAQVKEQAAATWKVGNKMWAEQVVLDWTNVNQEKLNAGIPVVVPDEVAVAKKALGMEK
jgi:hypothetical protein